MPSGRVALVGFDGAVPGCESRRFQAFGMRVLRTRRLDAFSWIALGDQAVRADPEEAAAAFDGRPERVILCPSRRDAAALRRWERVGITRVCAPGALAELEFLARRSFQRPSTALHEWTGRVVPPASRLSHALSVLEMTRPLDVGVWLAKLPQSSETVRRWCQAAFGLSCKGVVRRYRAFLFDRMVERGFRDWEIADELGVHDGPNAYRCRREDRNAGRLPPPEPHEPTRRRRTLRDRGS